MKIAVSATGPTLDAPVDSRFGRCQWFVLVDSEDMSYEGVANENAALGSGSGIQAAGLVAERGASVVLTGSCGPNAWETLAAAGIDVVLGCQGTVRQVVDRYKAGDLHPGAAPNAVGHQGMPASQRQTSGAGMGRGMGRGRGGRGGGRPNRSGDGKGPRSTSLRARLGEESPG